MELLLIFLRTSMIYVVVFFVLRLMGKREIGKLSVFDLVISIMIAEIAVLVIEDVNKPFIEGLIPIATLVTIQIVLAYITLKSRKLRLLVDGKPSIMIRNGKLDRSEMAKQRYSLDDLLLQLRQNNVTNVQDVEFAFLENTGKLTVIPKKKLEKQEVASDSKRNASPSNNEPSRSEKGKIRYEGLPIPLIMDGKVIDENLDKIDKNRFWLKNQLQEKGIYDFKQVFLCTYDHNGRLFIDRKNRA